MSETQPWKFFALQRLNFQFLKLNFQFLEGNFKMSEPCVLRNDFEKARGTYKRGLQTGPTTQERRRHLEVLRELRERTSQTDPVLAASIEAVIKELEQSSPR